MGFSLKANLLVSFLLLYLALDYTHDEGDRVFYNGP